MAMTDTPTVHASLSSLEVDGKPEPFRFGLPNGTITFPDPGDMDWLEAEEFMQQVQGGSNRALMQRWLSPGDYERLVAAKLTLRQMAKLGELVAKHYEDVFGSPGEGLGSTAS